MNLLNPSAVAILAIFLFFSCTKNGGTSQTTSGWSELGSVSDSIFNSLAIFHIATDTKNNVYATGLFFNGNRNTYVANGMATVGVNWAAGILPLLVIGFILLLPAQKAMYMLGGSLPMALTNP